MVATNSNKFDTHKGESTLSFERGSVLTYNTQGKDRDDLSAKISFTQKKDDTLEVSFGYVSFERRAWFGRELSLDLSQCYELKSFLDNYIEILHLKSTYTYVFLFDEHIKEDFIDKFFTEHEFVCQGRLEGKRIAKYKDSAMQNCVGISDKTNSYVIGNIYKISLFDKRRLDLEFNVNNQILNGLFDYPKTIDGKEYVKFNDKLISVNYYKLNDVSICLKYNHRDLTPMEYEMYKNLHEEYNFPIAHTQST